MVNADLRCVDRYCRAAGGHACSSAIRKAVPGAQEVISYKMPTYTLCGSRLLYFAAWAQHYSIYAATERVVDAFADELASYQADKGTHPPND
jgi:uncharacterized protein YdhG (YjbR/CyaY superfamily)